MKEYKLIRFTPRRSLTYNNRWARNVHPKNTLFFIPAEETQILAWMDFLCTKHHCSALYIHTIVLRAREVKTRMLTMWKGIPLIEVMVRDRDYHKRMKTANRRMLRAPARLPIIVQKFIKDLKK